MLLHVTMTHTEENCPGYHRERMPEILEAVGRRDELARQLGLKVHWLVNAAPDHRFFALVEADSPASVAHFFTDAMPFPHSFDVTPVQTIEDTIAMARAMMGGGGPR